MSVKATALSRSKLEQKDRSELAAIVEAMGGKAGSRAKKAELVDLVLQLAGAVRTQERDALARTDDDVDAVDGLNVFELLAQGVRFEDRPHVSQSDRPASWRWWEITRNG